MTIIIPNHLVGKMPCMWCGKIVTESSMDGPGVCGPCDMGYKTDETTGEFRKWRWDDPEQKQWTRGQPHEAFLYALWEDENK